MMKTTAEKISDRFIDGQVFTNAAGEELDDVCEAEGGRLEYRDGYRTGDVMRYAFNDESAILIAGDAWDLGYPGCYCWQGEGHTDECLSDRAEVI